MGPPATFPLGLTLLLASAGAASEEGFGGTSPHRENVEVDPECLLETEPGRWVSCDDAVAPQVTSTVMPLVSSGSAPDSTHTEHDGLLEALDAAAASAPAGAASSTSPQPPPLPGPYDIAIARVADAAPATFPLVKLREKVAAYPAKVESLLEVPFGFAEAEALRAEERLWQEILAHTEEIAVRRRSTCVQDHMPQWQSTYRAPPTFRMTPGGPVPIPVAERNPLPTFDPPGCERIKLVDEALIAQVARLHEIKQVLQSGRLGFFERDERRALEREAETIEAELGDGLPQPLPLPTVTTLPTLQLAPPGFGSEP
ncbi:MAG: hypothetical protein ACO3JL_18035 [Myxococcota bacterium]